VEEEAGGPEAAEGSAAAVSEAGAAGAAEGAALREDGNGSFLPCQGKEQGGNGFLSWIEHISLVNSDEPERTMNLNFMYGGSHE
jgi:hypothetical protein